MFSENRWLLPDGIGDILPENAGQLEALRRRLLDQFATWGYQYVIPPLVEFTDSLLIGLGEDLDLLTCKFSDLGSGRTLGVRADMTPQVARIDAHSLCYPGIARLCYSGSTLLSNARRVMEGRAPIQLGAELFGSESHDADSEIVLLMLATLQAAGVRPKLTLDIGHIGIYDALFRRAGLNKETEHELFGALQRKSLPEIRRLSKSLPNKLGVRLVHLSELHGTPDIINSARELFPDYAEILIALDYLQDVLDRVSRRHPAVSLYVDFTELRGFRYHTGLVFALYLDGHGSAIAKGGRYDNIGSVFGRDRPAVGFSLDLKSLVDNLQYNVEQRLPIFAPLLADLALDSKVEELRSQGEVVIIDFESSQLESSSRRLIFREGIWIVEETEVDGRVS